MQKMKMSGKKALALTLAAAMSVSGLSIAAPTTTYAGTAAEREDDSIIYFVDCGDINTATVPDDGQLGTHNSVTDQVYGTDAVTGYKWGIVDTVSSPLTNGSSGNGGVCTDWTWPDESKTTDQSSKTATYRYTKNQYENQSKYGKTRSLQYKFELEDGEYSVEVGFTDPWSCSKYPNLYANYGTDSQTTIQEKIDVSANGGVVTGTVKVTNGELTIDVKNSDNTDGKAINITYIEIGQSGDAAYAQKDLSAISVKTADVTADLDLITKGSKYGSTISWESSDPDVITTEGKVTRPAVGESDKTVTLTATVAYGSVTLTKEYAVTVNAYSDVEGMDSFDLTETVVTDSYYENALDKEIDYLLALDIDKLLVGFRETAGYASGMTAAQVKTYTKNATHYDGDWEDGLIGGHTLGHWMSAMSQAYANAGTSEEDKAQIKETLDEVVDALADCQSKEVGTDYEGFLFGAKLISTTNLDAQFDNVEKGLTNITTQAWVPWYTMHKIQAGLISVYELTGNEQAYEVSKALGDWIYNRVSNWSTTTQNKVLSIEYGGMNDSLYELYKIVKEKEGEDAAAKYAEAAHMFDEESLFKALSDGHAANALDGKHANTTIPKFLGALNRYITLGDETYLKYVEDFWDYVVADHSYLTGGVGEWEHFGADDVLDAERTNANCETCAVYNMLKISRQLFMITGDEKYSDYYENAFINSIMASQNPETGMSMYFQPMATGYQKVYSSEEHHFWCCTGSGMENFTKLNDSIYYKKDDNKLIVSQYLASEVTWEEANVKVTQSADLTKSETATFTVATLDDTQDVGVELRLRLPDWLASDATVTIDGEAYAYTVKSGYAAIPADKIANGTVITITLPMEVVAYNLQDGEDTYAFKYGPYVLAATLGTSKQQVGTTGVNVSVPTQKAVSNDNIYIKNADSVEDFMANINANLVKTKGKLEFTLNGTSKKYTFVPYYSIYEESYGVYWTYKVGEEPEADRVLADKESEREANALIEYARPGYGQDELGFSEESSYGSTEPCYRYADANGYFQYTLKVAEGIDNYLIVAFAKEDDGKTIKVSVGDDVIYNVTLDSTSKDATVVNLSDSEAESYYEVKIPISQEIIEKNKTSERVEGSKTVTAEDGYTFIPVRFESAKADEASAKLCVKYYVYKEYATTNALKSISSSTGTVSQSGNTYTVTVPYTEDVKVKIDIEDTKGYVAIDEDAIDETIEHTLNANNTYKIYVYAEDMTTVKTYTLNIVRDYTGVKLSSALKNSLVRYYSFDSKLDGAVAVTKNTVPDEVTNAEYTYVAGKSGKAIKLSGSYGLKLCDTEALGSSYTISFWMKADSIGGQYDPTFVAGTFDPQYWLNLTFNGRLWSDDGAWVTATATNCFKGTAGQWKHVAIVVDGTKTGTVSNTVNGKLYVDGELVSDGNVAKDIMTQAGAIAYFGVNAWDAYYTGAVDELMLFNRAVTASEVATLAGKTTTTTTKNVAATSVKLDKTSAALVVGKTTTLKATVAPSNATNKTVTYTSDNTAVATVSAKGVVTAKKAGTAKITAKTANGKTATCTVKVYAKTTKVSVKAAGYETSKITLAVKGKATLTAAVSPANAKQGVTYAVTTGKGVVTVSAKGVVTAKKAGTAKITVKSADGLKTQTVTVRVVKKAVVNKKLALKSAKVTLKKKGATAQITVKTLTSKTTSTISYKVKSGAKYVTVDKFGTVTAKITPGKKAVKAVIQVTCGKVSKNFTVTLKK